MGGGVIRCKDNNGNTYRPLEYKSISTSDTYYTTAINSEGLSNITVLTRASTSDVSYETRASTSGTNYGTRSSTSGTSYGTSTNTRYSSGSLLSTYIQSSYQNSDMYSIITGIQYSTIYVPRITSIRSSTRKDTVGKTGVTVTYYNFLGSSRNTVGSYTYAGSTTSSNPYIAQTSSTSSSRTYTTQGIIGAINKYNYTGTRSQYGVQTIESGFIDKDGSYLFTNGYTATGIIMHSVIGTVATNTIQSVTTGTTYLTRSSTSGTTYLTRSSTSNTIYLTRSSTSGYSGVSSSSSKSSGWE